MGASRTGTTRWKQLRAKVIRQAQRDGIENCPRCGVRLDYSGGPRQRNSVEADHIVPVAQGGADTQENVAVLCGHCNRKLGAKRTRKQPKMRAPSIVLKTSRNW